MISRIALIKPCCIGDVVMATALLTALRRGYPNAQIDWVVSSSAVTVLRGHPDLHDVIDSGPLANPASRPSSLFQLVHKLHRGHYDLAIVPDRSPLLGIAVLLAGIPQRAGLDSAGRGFTYTVKAPIDPAVVRHEAEIYLDIARALGLSTQDCWATVPPSPESLVEARVFLKEVGQQPLIIVHPGGGVNVGMSMTQKRWPVDRFAALADRVAEALGATIAVIGVSSDNEVTTTVLSKLRHPALDLTNRLSLPVTGALASIAALYIGNDNGVAHLAAASGGKVLMIFGPSDPRRYAPFVSPTRARVAWRPVALPAEGVSAGTPISFDWERDGVSVNEAWDEAQTLL